MPIFGKCSAKPGRSAAPPELSLRSKRIEEKCVTARVSSACRMRTRFELEPQCLGVKAKFIDISAAIGHRRHEREGSEDI